MHPTILETNGKSAFVVLPYEEYLALINNQPLANPRISGDDSVPHEVIRLQIKNNCN